MMMGRQDGFTIIEIILFMAISAALFVVAASYMSGTIRDVRFQDATKSIESFVEKHYTEVQTNAIGRPELPAGVGLECSVDAATRSYTVFNVTGANSGSSNTCIVLGAALHFRTDHIDVYPVIGTDKGLPAESNPLASARPTIYDGNASGIPVTGGPSLAYTLPWQSYWSDPSIDTPGIYMNGALTRFNTLTILRAPDSETISTYVIEPAYDASGKIVGARNGLHSAITTFTRINQQALLCLKTDSSGNMRGAIILDGAGGSSNNFSISGISSRILPANEIILGGMSCV